MYNPQLHQQINSVLQQEQIDVAGKDNLFFTRFIANATAIHALFHEIYGQHPDSTIYFDELLRLIARSYVNRPEQIKLRDEEKEGKGSWFLSNEITGMSLYVDRFCGTIQNMETKLDYFKKLGVCWVTNPVSQIVQHPRQIVFGDFPARCAFPNGCNTPPSCGKRLPCKRVPIPVRGEFFFPEG